MRSYLDPHLEPLQRLSFAFYAMFATQAWFADVKAKDSAAKLASKQQCDEVVNRICTEKKCSKKEARAELAKEKKEKKAAEKLARETKKLANKLARKEKKAKKLGLGCAFQALCMTDDRFLVLSLPSPHHLLRLLLLRPCRSNLT